MDTKLTSASDVPTLVLAFDSPYTPLSTHLKNASGTVHYYITGRGTGVHTRIVVTRADKEIASLEWHSFSSDKIYLNESVYPIPVKKLYHKKTFVDERDGQRYQWDRIGKGPGINFELHQVDENNRAVKLVARCASTDRLRDQTMAFWTTDETLQNLAVITSTIYMKYKEYDSEGAGFMNSWMNTFSSGY